MMGAGSLLRGLGVVLLAIVEIECGYRVMYWYWMTVSTPNQVQVAQGHLHTWLTVAVMVGMAWMYLAWKLLMEDFTAKKKKKPVSIRKTTMPGL
jgi:hypothetical protein